MYAGPDHPRIRGEHADDERSVAAGGGSSPHTRGAQRLAGAGDRVFRIIPAYAGSTPVYTLAVVGVRDHPRIRGEHLNWLNRVPLTTGSSPHTRGARSGPPRGRGTCRIIPAYAGSTWIDKNQRIADEDHPRIRGEHAGGAQQVPGARGSSPHTRGAPCPDRPGEPPGRIIPAYAGSTSGASRLGRPVRDHPRIRGEHARGFPYAFWRLGSSPHTRGALDPRRR